MDAPRFHQALEAILWAGWLFFFTRTLRTYLIFHFITPKRTGLSYVACYMSEICTFSPIFVLLFQTAEREIMLRSRSSSEEDLVTSIKLKIWAHFFKLMYPEQQIQIIQHSLSSNVCSTVFLLCLAFGDHK